MKILLCYDGSDEAHKALDLAQTHAKAFDGEIHAVTAMQSTPDLDYNEIQKAERLLRDVERDCQEKRIDCKTHVAVRDLEVGESIIQYSRENNIDEVVLGIRKTSKVGKILFGSTAQYVILESDCPVATIK